MSLRSIAAMRAEAEDKNATRATAVPAQEQQKLRDQLVALIPAESLAAFVALIAYFADYSYTMRWVLFGIVFVCTPALVWVTYIEKAATTEARRTVPIRQMVIGTVAFVAWAMAVPANPFLSIDGFTLQLGAGVAIAAGFVLPLIGRLFGGLTPVPTAR